MKTIHRLRKHLPKKSLGQHFLRNKEILKRIVDIRNLKDQNIIEIGPGKGALTKYILNENPSSLVCIEKDVHLKIYLEKIVTKFPNKIKIFYNDILKLDLEYFLNEKNTVLIGNLPYNIATTLIINLLEHTTKYKFMIFMVQKEVADRLTAEVGSKNYGRISVLSRVYGKTHKVFDVDADNFHPIPKVDSSVLVIEPRNFEKIEFNSFKDFLRKAFLYRRKIIRNSLSKFFDNFEEKLKKSNLDLCKRPQNFSSEEYVRMYSCLFF